MAKGFAGGAYVKMSLEGAKQVDQDLQALDKDMRQFVNIVRQLKRNFGVDAMVNDMNEFTVSGERSKEAIEALEKSLKGLGNIQQRTNVIIKDGNEALKQQAREERQYKEAQEAATQQLKARAKHAKVLASGDKIQNKINVERRLAAEKEKAARWDEQAAAARKKAAAAEKARQAAAKAAATASVRAARDEAKAAERAAQGHKKAAAATKRHKNAVAEMKDAMGKLKRSFLAFHFGIRVIRNMQWAINASLGSLQRYARDIDEIGKKAQAMGTSMEFLSTLRFATEQMGGNFQQLTTAMSAMQRNFGMMTIGGGEAGKALEMLGVQAKDLEGLSPEEQFLKMTDALAGIEDINIRNAAAQKIFAEGAKDVMNMINGGTNGFREYQEQAEALGIVLGEDDKNGSAKFMDAMSRMQKVMEAWTSKLVTLVAPALEEFSVWFSALLQVMNEFDGEAGNQVDASYMIASSFETVKAVIMGVIGSFYTLMAAGRWVVGTWNDVQASVYFGISSLLDGLKQALGVLGIVSQEVQIQIESAALAASKHMKSARKEFALANANMEKAQKAWQAMTKQGDLYDAIKEKRDEIMPTLDINIEPPDLTPLKNTQEEIQKSRKLVAQLSGATEYGIEGINKARENVEARQLLVLQRIAENTKNAPVPVGL